MVPQTEKLKKTHNICFATFIAVFNVFHSKDETTFLCSGIKVDDVIVINMFWPWRDNSTSREVGEKIKHRYFGTAVSCQNIWPKRMKCVPWLSVEHHTGLWSTCSRTAGHGCEACFSLERVTAATAPKLKLPFISAVKYGRRGPRVWTAVARELM